MKLPCVNIAKSVKYGKLRQNNFVKSEHARMPDEKLLLLALGVLLGVIGFLLKYIFGSHNKKIEQLQTESAKQIEELQANCTKVASDVRAELRISVKELSASVKELSARVDGEVDKLDRDIKNVGAKLAEQISILTRDLFTKIDDNRKEVSAGIQAVNSRLDGIFNQRGGPSQ